jgi:hypothetical protein
LGVTQTPFSFRILPGGQTFRHRFVAGLISSPSLHFFVAFVTLLTQTPFSFLVLPGGQTFRHRFVAGLISSPSLHGFTFNVTFLFFFGGGAG